MKQISTSSLNELKSVFNSADDNVHYYRILNNAFNRNDFGVELAQPLVRESSGQIIWKSESNAEFVLIDSVSESEQNRAYDQVRTAFASFKEKVSGMKNFPPDFQQKIMEIPGSSSVLVSNSTEKLHVVITNWGFLEDSLDRKSGILESLFPAPSYSILACVVSPTDEPIPNKKIELRAVSTTSSDVTDDRGYARLGSVTRGASFNLYDDSGKLIAGPLVSDPRSEYQVRIAQQLSMKFRVKTSFQEPVTGHRLAFVSPELGRQNFQTDGNGEFQLTHPACASEYKILDADDNEIHSAEIPSSDAEIDLIIDIPAPVVPPALPLDEPEEEVFEEPGGYNVRFTNFWGRPIKKQSFSITDTASGATVQGVTNDKGQSAVLDSSLGEKTLHFQNSKAQWEYKFVHSIGTSSHHFQRRRVYPWLWWLLCAVLLALLLCCLLWSRCWCNCDRPVVEHVRHAPEELVDEPIENDELEDRRDSHGGGVGDITITLSWNSMDDLDLMLIEPSGDTIYFKNKRSRSGGHLDIDMNADEHLSRQPIENIYYAEAPRKGRYNVLVHYFKHQAGGSRKVPYEVYVKVGAQEQTFSGEHTREKRTNNVYSFDYDY
jgi:hypothetical protein